MGKCTISVSENCKAVALGYKKAQCVQGAATKPRRLGGEEWSLSGDKVRESVQGAWRLKGRTGYFTLFVVEATEDF